MPDPQPPQHPTWDEIRAQYWLDLISEQYVEVIRILIAPPQRSKKAPAPPGAHQRKLFTVPP